MFAAFREIDQILRGERTRPTALDAAGVPLSLARVGFMLILLGAIYGASVGLNGVFGRPVPEWRQVAASAVKVPALFLLTGAITFPSLYVFSALLDIRLSAASMLKLLFAAGAVTLALLASLGPIVAFFSVSTSSYLFMVFLTVLCFALAGLMGTQFLWRTLQRLTAAAFGPPAAQSVADPETGEAVSPAPPPPPLGPLEALAQAIEVRRVRGVFFIWGLLFAVVGAQTGWLLRPFVGNPQVPFAWLRPKDSNFFEAIWQVITALLAGKG
ncbi:MAG TPA: hypothetical protein VNC50_05095 [Planctomycetia bacterium]|nr:hypothetical protein [Planctomycetia bacterium]